MIARTTSPIALAEGDRLVTDHDFLVRGIRFEIGDVQLFIDDVNGTYLGTARVNSDANGTFTAAVGWPHQPTGHHRVIAVQGTTLISSVTLEIEHPPA